MKKYILPVVAAGLLATPALAEVYPAPPGSALHELVSAQAHADCLFSSYHFVDNINVDANAMNIIATCTDGTDSGVFTFPINDNSVRAEVANLASFYSDTADLAAAEAAINAGLPLDASGEALDMEEVNERVELLEAALDALGKSEDLELGDYPIANQDPTYPSRWDYPQWNGWQWANYVYSPWFHNYFYPEVVRPWFDQQEHILNISYIVGDMLDDDFDAMIEEMFAAATPVDNNNGKSEDNNYDPDADHSNNTLFNKQVAPAAPKTKLQQCQEEWNEGIRSDSCYEVRRNPEANSGDGIDDLMAS